MLMSKIPFKLIKQTAYIFNRTARGTEVDGEWIKPAPTQIEVLALITPYIRKNAVEILPEALRKRKVVRIFSNVPLIEHIDTGAFEADEFTYSGESYRVFKLGDWVNTSRFTGYEAFAVRIDSKELSLLSG